MLDSQFHMTCVMRLHCFLHFRVLFDMNLSLLQGIGQVLVIFAILYILLHFGSRFAEIELFPKWLVHTCDWLVYVSDKEQSFFQWGGGGGGERMTTVRSAGQTLHSTVHPWGSGGYALLPPGNF